MHRHLLVLLAVLVFSVTSPAQGTAQAQADKPLRVLFIGNSYTIFNNLPYLLEQIAESQKGGPRIETATSLCGGKTLKWHWENRHALEAVRRGGWDFVVLQEQSLLGNTPKPGESPYVNDPSLYQEYAAKFDAEIRQVGARTILYATWARDGYPEQQRRLDDAFIRVAATLDAGIIPAGLAWTVTRIEAPAIRLYTPDRSHPTMAGTYLNTLLFYQCLTGRRVSNPPTTMEGPKWNEATRVNLVNLSWSDATILNQIAQRVAAQEPRCTLQ